MLRICLLSAGITKLHLILKKYIMKLILKVILCVAILLSSKFTFAQSSIGQVPCYKLLDWYAQSPSETKMVVSRYIGAVIDGANIQLVWIGVPRESLIIYSYDESSIMPFVINYCDGHANDNMSVIAAAFVSRLSNKSKTK